MNLVLIAIIAVVGSLTAPGPGNVLYREFVRGCLLKTAAGFGWNELK